MATHLPDLPGSAEGFDWPATPAEAEQALTDFIDHWLPEFGRYQGTMWTGHGVLDHARISTALNLQLQDPRRSIGAAEAAWQEGGAAGSGEGVHPPDPGMAGFLAGDLEEACPFTTLYWVFLDRREAHFANHPRMGMAVKNLRRLDEAERQAFRERAAGLRNAPP